MTETLRPSGPSTPTSSWRFVFRAVDEVGATLNTALVVMGDKLGYYRAMADGRPITPAELAEHTGTGEPYAREWLYAQAAGGYVEYDAAAPPLHAAGRARRRAHRPDAAPRTCPGSSSSRTAPCATPRRSSTAAPTATASAGTRTTATCTTAASGSSAPCTTGT